MEFHDLSAKDIHQIANLFDKEADYIKTKGRGHQGRRYIKVDEGEYAITEDKSKGLTVAEKASLLEKIIKTPEVDLKDKYIILKSFHEIFEYEKRKENQIFKKTIGLFITDENDKKIKQKGIEDLKKILKHYVIRSDRIYEGDFKDDRLNGYGRSIFPSGKVLEGEFKEGMLNGKGKEILPDGTVSEGVFKNDILEGQGWRSLPDGIVVECEFIDDSIGRISKITYSDGDVYEGQIVAATSFQYGANDLIKRKDLIINGGRKTCGDGTLYEGEFKSGRLNGHGKIIHPNGMIEEGEFIHNCLNGHGKRTHSDGMIEEGNFFSNQLNGKGQIIFPDKTTYTGEFSMEVPNRLSCSNPLIEDVSYINPYLWRDILKSFPSILDNNDVDKRLDYLNKMIFGFSTGQRHHPNSLKQQLGFEQNEINRLEGSYTIYHMHYIYKNLDKIITKETDSGTNPSYVESLKKLKECLRKSLFVNLVLYNKVNEKNPSLRDYLLKLVSREISNKLKTMEPGEKFLVPTGCIGHATLLVFEKKQEGLVIPTFYNTGFGLRKITRDKPSRLNALLSKRGYKKEPISCSYPPIDLKEKDQEFQLMMQKILNTELEKEVDSIHDALKETCGLGEPGKPKKIQMNGVCSFQCLSAAIKDMLGQEQYIDFKIGLLTHIQEDLEGVRRDRGPKASEILEDGGYAVLQAKLLKNNALAIAALKLKKKGLGKLTTPDGTIYEGQFINNKFTGRGKVAHPDGKIAKGKFKDNSLIQGVIIFPDGRVSKGKYKNNKLDGKGKAILEDGRILEGQFKDGELNGPGKLTRPDGQVDEGQFKDNKLIKGVVTLPDGTIFEGEFRNNKPDGKCKMTKKTGDIVELQYKDGKLNGAIKLIKSNGTVVLKQFKDSKLEGG